MKIILEHSYFLTYTNVIILGIFRYGDIYTLNQGPLNGVVVNGLEMIEEISHMDVFSGRFNFNKSFGVRI